MTFSSSIHADVSETASVLQGVLATALTNQRKEGGKHDKMLADSEKRAKHYAKLHQALVRKAIRGAKKLVQMYKSPEVTELLSLVKKTHGSRHALRLYESHVDYRLEFLNWQWTECNISMSSQGVFLFVQQVTPARSSTQQEKTTCLNNPLRLHESREFEEPVSIHDEIQEFLELEPLGDEFIVESVKALDIFKEAEGGKAKVAWLAFLVACNDEENLARLLRETLKRLMA